MLSQLLYVKGSRIFLIIVSICYFGALFVSDLYFMEFFGTRSVYTLVLYTSLYFAIPIALMPFVIWFSLSNPLFRSWKQLVSHLIISLIYVVVFVFLAQFFRMAIDGYFMFSESSDYILTSLSRQFLVSGSLAFLSYWGIVVLSGLQVYFKNLSELTDRANQLEEKLSKATLSTLKAQLKPHFLFNTLNMVDFLIHTDHQKAIDTLSKLEDLIKSTFDQNQPNTCTINDEIQFLNKYLEIEKARFKNRLEVMLEIDPTTEDIKIPCYLVQPLVENSIKHAVGKMLSTCTIKIRSILDKDGLRLDILDTGTSSPAKNNALTWGVGLKNIDERLKLFYGPDALLQIGFRQEGGFQSSVIIPKKYLL